MRWCGLWFGGGFGSRPVAVTGGVEAVGAVGSMEAQAFSVGPWRAGWLRFRRDGWNVAALVAVVVVVFLGFFGGAVVSRLVGHGGNEQFPFAASSVLRPVGPFARVPAPRQLRYDDYGGLVRPKAGGRTALLILGADGPLGRDELIRLLDGLRVSLSVAIGAALIALLIALPVGCVSGYFGGVTDAVVSQFTEIIMAFPLLLFLVFANTHLQGLRAVGWGWEFPAGVLDEALLIGVFTAFYPTRLIRAQMLTLRNAEFVESARMVGASHWRIMRRHLVPHLAPTLLVWAAVAVGTNILIEVGLSFIGVGVQVSTPTLGSLLTTVWGTVYNPQTYNSHDYTPWQTILPMLTIIVTVASLNRLAEGVRRAMEPKEQR
jgi:ABC-type dipeptide/oligopeptide/nickel transport system permease subunit